MGLGVRLMQLGAPGTVQWSVDRRGSLGLACRRTNLTIRLKLLEQRAEKSDCFWVLLGERLSSAPPISILTFHGSADVAYWCSCLALRAEAAESGRLWPDGVQEAIQRGM